MNRSFFTTLLTWLLLSAQADAVTPTTIKAVEYSRRTIYRSPQHPGYTCWTSAWLMPDESLWVCFTQATGPMEGRPKTPPHIRHKLSWPPGGNEAYDMNGLKLENIYLRSADQGKSWTKMSSDTFRSPMNAMGGTGTTATKNGTILREVLGHYLPFDDSVPQTGFIQRSFDQAKSWSKPILLLDPERYSTWPTRIRVLEDGRILVLGGLAHHPAKNDLTRNEICAELKPLMILSDDNGQSWQGPLDVLTNDALSRWKGTEEWDIAELSDGNLLALFRRDDPSVANVRWQALLTKDGRRWKAAHPEATPLPSGGYPELLFANEGVVLYFTAGSGQAWTADAGKTWNPLEIPIDYYPRSVQTQDGQIFVFSHVGADDPYGAKDQSIVMDTFRLNVNRD